MIRILSTHQHQRIGPPGGHIAVSFWTECAGCGKRRWYGLDEPFECGCEATRE